MNSVYNQMPLDKPSQLLTNFVIAGQKICFKHFFKVSLLSQPPFHLFMSSIFKPLIRKNKFVTYLVFIQDTTTDTMLQTIDKNHKILKDENLTAAPDKSFFFFESVKFLRHQIQNSHIHPLK